MTLYITSLQTHIHVRETRRLTCTVGKMLTEAQNRDRKFHDILTRVAKMVCSLNYLFPIPRMSNRLSYASLFVKTTIYIITQLDDVLFARIAKLYHVAGCRAAVEFVKRTLRGSHKGCASWRRRFVSKILDRLYSGGGPELAMLHHLRAFIAKSGLSAKQRTDLGPTEFHAL
jgi:hypothetical protein